MTILSVPDFALAFGISRQAAWKALRAASQGDLWRGLELPVCAQPGQRGGAGGTVWALRLDACSPPLLAKLGMASTAFEAPLKPALNASLQARQFDEQAERLRIIQPILSLPTTRVGPTKRYGKRLPS